MDPALLSSVGQIGLGGIVFVIWYFDQKRITTLQEIVTQMREERTQLLAMIGQHARLTERATSVLERLELRFNKR